MGDEDGRRTFCGPAVNLLDGSVRPGRMTVERREGEVEVTLEVMAPTDDGEPGTGAVGWSRSYARGWEGTFGKN